MRRKANAEKSKCSINTKSVNKFQDELRACRLIIVTHWQTTETTETTETTGTIETEQQEQQKQILFDKKNASRNERHFLMYIKS